MSDDRAAEGVEHLQTAALELIAAARAFLDVAEDLVTDPDRVSGALAALATLVDGAGRSARPGRARPAGSRSGPTPDGEGPAGSGDGGGPDAPPRLRRIDLA